MNLTRLKYKVINDYFIQPIRPFSKEIRKRNLVTGVEVGTARGENAANILRTCGSVEKLYCIDSYPIYLDGDGKEKDFSIYKDEARERLSPFTGRVEILIADSIDACSNFDYGSLDFVYLDGLHTEHIYDEASVFLKKVRVGGLLGGDDFSCEYSSMIHAIVDFSNNNNLVLTGFNNDWWVIK